MTKWSTLALVALTFSCASVASIRNAPPSKGVSQSYSADFDRVLKAARESVVEAGLQIEEVNKTDEESWVIIAKKSTSAWSWGELVRVTVSKVNDSEATVRVLTRRRLATNITAKGDYSRAILSNIELKLR